MTTYLMSTSIIPSGFEGIVEVRNLTIGEAWRILNRAMGYVSAVGHKSTAEALSILLDMPIEADRITVKVELYDNFVCFQLNSRPPEGKILTLKELEAIGYSLRELVFLPLDYPYD